MSVANLHTLYMRSVPLCVECRQCKHRSTLGSDVLPIHSGNMTQIRRLRLRCKKCGGDNIERIVPADFEAAKLFATGHPIQSADAV